jgi:CO dehydrogenase maturation factor
LLAEILSAEADVTVVDMEAGLEHLSRSGGTLRYVDHLIIVVEPYVKAVETARRTIGLATELGIPRISLLASKVRDTAELAGVQTLAVTTGVPIIGAVPYDESVRLADRDGLAPLDAAPQSALVEAVRRLAAELDPATTAVPA